MTMATRRPLWHAIAARALYYLLFPALAALIVAGVDSVLGGSHAANIARLVVGAVLIVEGVPLVLPQAELRRPVVDRLLVAAGRGRLWRLLLSPTLFVLGVVFAGVGVLELLRGAQGLI